MIRRNAVLGKTTFFEEDTVNPLEAIANLSDIMLVFAVALMVALLSHYQVDFAATSDVSASELTEIDVEVDSESTSVASGGNTEYEELGILYHNVETDTYYILGE